MSINAVKGVEIGTGFELASLTGFEANDEIFLIIKETIILDQTTQEEFLEEFRQDNL